jgi:hypothetical protein
MVMWPSGIPTLPIELTALANIKYKIVYENSWGAHAKQFAQQNTSPWMTDILTCQNGQTNCVNIAHSCLAPYYGFFLSKFDTAIPTVAYLLLKTATKIMRTYSQLLANTQGHKISSVCIFHNSNFCYNNSFPLVSVAQRVQTAGTEIDKYW